MSSSFTTVERPFFGALCVWIRWWVAVWFKLSARLGSVTVVDAIEYQLARTLLTIEGKRWRFEAVKLDEVKRQTGLSPTRYYQLLRTVAVEPSPELAAEFAPVIRRLRARIETKLRAVAPRKIA